MKLLLKIIRFASLLVGLISFDVIVYNIENRKNTEKNIFEKVEKPPIADEVDQKKLYQHVKILSQYFSPRSYLNIENLNAVAEYIKGEFELSKGRVKEQLFEVKGEIYKNIVAEFGAIDGPKIIIGAHYDVAGEKPGADDNASGVAGLLEIARLLGKSNLKTNVTLIAYTLEEPPFFRSRFMGSYIHAKSAKEKNEQIKLMICLEMIGYYTDEPESQSFPLSLLRLYYPTVGNYIVIVDQLWSKQGPKMKNYMNRFLEVPVHSINAPSILWGIDFSDHKNYWAEGYDAVMITDTAFYRNPFYHTYEDTIEKLDFNRMSDVVSGILLYTLHLSNEPE